MTASDKKWLKIGGGTLAAIALYKIFAPKKDSSTSVDDPTGNGGTSNFNANEVAEKLFIAMNQLGTDEDALFDALKNVSQAQFVQVFEAFGKKEYNPATGNQSGWFLLKHDLKSWMKHELSSNDYGTLKLKFPNKL